MYIVDYNVDKTENCVLIDCDNWLSNSSNSIQEYRLSGKKVLTYITKVVETNLTEDFEVLLSKGDTILISKIASEVSQYKGHYLLDDHKYFDVPIMQVLGVFKEGIISAETLTLLTNKILFKKESIAEGTLKSYDSQTTVGRILKVGTNAFTRDWKKVPLNISPDDLILVKDNVSTKIILNGEEYYVTEESSVVCIFDDSKTLENAKFINEVLLLSPYIPEKLTDSLWTPAMDYENADYTDVYNRNRFKVDYIDSSLTGLKKGDIIWVDRNFTMYAFFKGNRYFLLNGKDSIDFKEL